MTMVSSVVCMVVVISGAPPWLVAVTVKTSQTMPP
jgi:hypothetical protein